jgi:hypothetical protein
MKIPRKKQVSESRRDLLTFVIDVRRALNKLKASEQRRKAKRKAVAA